MTAHKFDYPADFDGPAGCLAEGHLVIEFEHSKADPSVGADASITINSIVVVIGAYTGQFDGDYGDADLVAACWRHLADEKERIECERADWMRQDAEDVQALMDRDMGD